MKIIMGYFFKILAALTIIFIFLTINGCNNNTDISSDYNTYKGSDFEFNYPNMIILNEEENGVHLSHLIPYEHTDPCDFKGDSQPLDYLTDFEVTITFENLNLKDTLQLWESEHFISEYYIDQNELLVIPDYIDKVNAGELNGFKVTNGVEGCGVYQYYFPIDSNNTLIISRSFITELMPITTNYEEYSKLEGVILPNEEERIFKEILASLKVIKRD